MSRTERVVVCGVLALLVLHALVGVPVLAPRRAHAGDAVPDMVTARAFRLVDKDGSERALLSAPTDPAHAWGLELRGKGDKRSGVWLGLNGDGSPMLSLTGKDGMGSIVLQALADGSGWVVLSDKDKKRRIGLAIASDGSPYLQLVDKDGKSRAMIDTDAGAPSITLSSADGSVLWRVPPK